MHRTVVIGLINGLKGQKGTALIVYKIVNNINGKTYIGVTKKPLKRRIAEHRCCNSHIGNAFKKYGLQSFTIQVIDEAENKNDLSAKEIHWIRFYNSKFPVGYNHTDGGEGLRNISDAVRLKMSLSHKGKKRPEVGEAISIAKKGRSNGREGYHHSAATIAKMRKVRTDDFKQKIKDSWVIRKQEERLVSCNSI